jgi:hypothetical protein
MRASKCGICGGLFPRRDMAKMVLPWTEYGDLVRWVCPQHWKPIEAVWRQMEGEQLGPRPDRPTPSNVAPVYYPPEVDPGKIEVK